MARQNVELANVDVERLLRQIIDERPEVQNPRAGWKSSSPLLPVRGHEASLTRSSTTSRRRRGRDSHHGDQFNAARYHAFTSVRFPVFAAS
jgi:hypothetical protein